MNRDRIKDTEDSMLFFDLLILLREIARLHLGFSPDPKDGEYKVDVSSARRIVDMLNVLKGKTAGNLSEQETMVLDNLLSELMMACVRAKQKGSEDDVEGEDAEKEDR